MLSDWNNFWHGYISLEKKQNGIVCISIFGKIFSTIQMWTTLKDMQYVCALICMYVSPFTDVSQWLVHQM